MIPGLEFVPVAPPCLACRVVIQATQNAEDRCARCAREVRVAKAVREFLRAWQPTPSTVAKWAVANAPCDDATDDERADFRRTVERLVEQSNETAVEGSAPQRTDERLGDEIGARSRP